MYVVVLKTKMPPALEKNKNKMNIENHTFLVPWPDLFDPSRLAGAGRSLARTAGWSGLAVPGQIHRISAGNNQNGRISTSWSGFSRSRPERLDSGEFVRGTGSPSWLDRRVGRIQLLRIGVQPER
jgi:hypothetical protein